MGFTSIFSQTTASVALAGILKSKNPALLTVLGGPACTGETGMEFATLFGEIDYVFSGSGLVSFPEFVEHYLDGNLPACDQIDGVFSRARVSHGQRGGEAASLDTKASLGAELDINANIPLDYGDFLSRFSRTFPEGGSKPRLLLETSRGCSWGEREPCRFCGLNGPSRSFRYMNSGHALAQIQSLLRYGPQCDFFASVDNVMPAQYLEEVFPHISRCRRATPFNTRFDPIWMTISSASSARRG